ncbi:MAG: RNA 2',3'-cyclic phosphodiesterase [Planctomycetaceae bacterium]|nr:RNA 2',3'-cyclic phosphodiesterase [Planctomycetaceae bacterium]MBQ2822224.1 RNA 2',3'-cyclic phosphodiesterase [Thermoguttaceae bacterium]MDO4425047.1 RNA 2',3'-cyclic phosphodiesterase [Planctomycetia bacterium]
MDFKIRTFIGVEIAEKPRLQTGNFAKKLMLPQTDIKWEPPHKYHVTLKFLDEILNEEVNDICLRVQRAVQDFPAFTLGLCGAGAFPSIEKPRTIWVGVKEGKEEIIELARRVDRAMQEAGFPRELRPFSPHITLGRLRRATPGLVDLSQLLTQYQNIDLGKSFIRSVTVFASHMARSGSSYTTLATCPLAEK